ncbi:hypothetical protein UFOVP410_104 [uncultured Caudovirales phage]|uniref:Uncharacterized protein n=1 Tax=uncultured Caudovirales phage TaxID=2100421 RepID=A0A6J5M2V0_9CAUD|nr:hypothetical protein UFOVP410_104 [uncultured Caudovirales phage]
MNTDSISVKEAKELALKKSILISNRWKHRRRMAYISLLSILIVTYFLMFKIPIEKIKVLENVVTWYYITMSSIIGAYLGFATLDDKWKKEPKEKDE